MKTLAAIDHDLHLHTGLSACCKDPAGQAPARVIARAASMGLHTIAFTDHLWVNPALAPSRWYRPQDGTGIVRLREQLAAIDTPLRVLVGCEAETIAPGRFGLTRSFAATLDFVLLACTHVHMKGFVAQPPDDTPAAMARHLAALFASAVSSGLASAIPHPFVPHGRLEIFDRVVAAIGDRQFADLFGPAAENGVALEVTVGYLPGPDRPFSGETPLRLLTLARRAGCRFTFGSDAHDPARQRRLPELLPLARAAGIGGEHLWVGAGAAREAAGARRG